MEKHAIVMTTIIVKTRCGLSNHIKRDLQKQKKEGDGRGV